MIVQLNKGVDYPDLSENDFYFVIGIESDSYRVLNDYGKPYLYPVDLFNITDLSEPSDWVTEFGEDGERYSYPRQLNEIGFFEDFFDRKPTQISIFWHVVNQKLAQAA
ncbi:MAG: hypothetical protein HN963_03390 [Thiotrichales bacterium]|jgi:hypothetical protein|nr:hypothetical protein [Thiotrichales bacterium]MBT7005955.1 hypothetical protein [Thiotrichales bacterium]